MALAFTPKNTLTLSTAVLMLLVVQINLPNLGNNLIPRNFFAWGVLYFTAGVMLFQAMRRGELRVSPIMALWLIPLVAIPVHSVLVPAPMAHYVTLAWVAVLGFALWFVALNQACLTQNDWVGLSNWVLAGTLVLVLLALPSANYLNLPELLYGLPLYLQLPEGGFQQRNVFASFTAAVLLWCWVLRLRLEALPSARSAVLFSSVAFVLCVAVMLSGSRTGLVALIGCVGLAVAQGLYKHGARAWVLGPVCAVAVAFVFTQFNPFGALEDLSARVADLQAGSSTATRLSMWQVSWVAGLQSPWLGHGLGSFTEVMAETWAKLAQQGAELTYVNFLNHPHNETLLWWLEAGLFGWLLVILPMGLALLWLAFRKNPNGLLMGAALGPILLHSQTEFPLHASGLHWWLVGLIVVSLASTHGLKRAELQKGPLWGGVTLALCTLVTWVAVDSGRVSYLAWSNARQADTSSIANYVESRAGHAELNHWIMGQQSTDFYWLTLAQMTVASGDPELQSQLLPVMQDLARRWHGPQVWETTAGLLHGLERFEERDAYLAQVALFKPEVAAQIREKLAL